MLFFAEKRLALLRIEQLTWHGNIETLNEIFYLGAINFFWFESIPSYLQYIAVHCIVLLKYFVDTFYTDRWFA